MADFTGFTYGGKHSSDIGIIRVSDGDRYEEAIHPEIEDKTAEVPGLDGSYYFGSNYRTKNISVKIAFDYLTEEQFRNLKKIFNPTEIKELIFDEIPYKKYMAKLEGPMELSFVCFDANRRILDDTRDGVRRIREGNDSSWEQVIPYKYLDQKERVYKGEGTINFICYFPFAKSVFKSVPVGEEQAEWVLGSRILTSAEYALYDNYDNNEINIYNAGDVSTGFRLYIPGELTNAMTLTYRADSSVDTQSSILKIKPLTLKTGDIGILIDSNNALIVGVSSYLEDISGNAIYTTSGNLYNEYIDSGYFFKLEPNIKNDGAKITFTNGKSGMKIFYDYLYF